MTEPPFFQESYEECRAAFREGCREAGRGELRAEERAIAVPADGDGDLTIDSFFLPAREEPRGLVLITSGVHGIEGFTGSAVQQMFLAEILPHLDRGRTGALLVHGVNPFGFKHCRRVTERNVDLNRNFSSDPGLFSSQNPGYEAFSPLLNPAGPASAGPASLLRFAAGCLRAALKAGIPAFRQATLGGQYTRPQGIFFGGSAPEPQNGPIADLIGDLISGYRNVLFLDLHTGYGTRGVLHLLDLFRDELTRSRIDTLFAGLPVVGRNPGDDFYQVSGDFQQFITHRHAGKCSIIPMTFEFGTADTLGLPGGFASLRTTVLENQMAAYGARTPADEKIIRRRYAELFYPSDPAWRAGVIRQCREVFSVILPRFREQI
ncbi:MAG: M14 family metallopeptidase [Thermodesulfobacteriota bacterium]